MTIITVHYDDPLLTDEFWAKTEEDTQTGCWIWVSRTSRTGTPMHGAKVAWRYAYDRLIAPVLKGAIGRRVCDNSQCVNPAHRILTQPKQCPTCHQNLPESDTTITALKLADGKVALKRVSAEPEPEPEAARLPRAKSPDRLITMTPEEARQWSKPEEPRPEPEDDPNHVEYGPDELKLTGRVWVKDASNVNDWVELSDSTWIPIRAMSPAQESDATIRDDIDFVGNPERGWRTVEELPKGARAAYARRRRGES